MVGSISIIGKGAFGTALNSVYAGSDFDVRHYGRDAPERLDPSYLFLAVPTQSVSDALSTIEVAESTTIVLCSKGFLPNGALVSSLMGAQRYAVLSGPGFAHEISNGLPTVHTIAAPGDTAIDAAQALSTPSFRLYSSNDPVGVQVCGGFKNILAIAAGITDGLKLGENARAALISRGLSELASGMAAFGGQRETVLSPAGVGDLVLTCMSDSSRNYRCGRLIGQGRRVESAIEEIGTVEGAWALKGFLAKVGPNEAPISQALADVFSGTMSATQAVERLMERPLRHSE